MAENETNSKSAAEIEKELSVGNFAALQARTIGLQVAGIIGGWLVGKYGLAKTSLPKKVGEWLPNFKRFSNEIVIGGSAIIGSLLGSLTSMYEHWVKVERERITVQEINKDVDAIMQKRVQFEDTLDKQHTIVKDLLARSESRGAKSILEKREEDGDKSLTEKVVASKEAAASAERTGP